MIKNCIITPTQYINIPQIGGQSDFLLVLSHLIGWDNNGEPNEYTREVISFREEQKKPLYLDNGLFENHQPENSKDLLIKAIKLEVKVVFAPDYLFDNQKTQQSFEEFANLAEEMRYTGDLAYVVQADNMMTYASGFKWALKNPRIDLIGMSILSIPKSFGPTENPDITISRIAAIEMLDFYLDIDKPIHLLGLGGSLQDLKFARNFKWIQSNDSCSAFMTGFYGKRYDQNLQVPGGKIEEKVDFNYDGELSSKQIENILYNIQVLKDVLRN